MPLDMVYSENIWQKERSLDSGLQKTKKGFSKDYKVRRARV
jgi:hypothetical protein